MVLFFLRFFLGQFISGTARATLGVCHSGRCISHDLLFSVALLPPHSANRHDAGCRGAGVGGLGGQELARNRTKCRTHWTDPLPSRDIDTCTALRRDPLVASDSERKTAMSVTVERPAVKLYGDEAPPHAAGALPHQLPLELLIDDREVIRTLVAY